MQQSSFTKKESNIIGLVLLMNLANYVLEQTKDSDREFTSLVLHIENNLDVIRRVVLALGASGSTSTPAPAKDT